MTRDHLTLVSTHRAVTGVNRAMPQAARATHAPHRAVFHRLGLSVGITIAASALSGCSGSFFVWTAGDVFGLIILGLIAVGFLLLLAANLIQIGVRKLRRLFAGDGK